MKSDFRNFLKRFSQKIDWTIVGTIAVGLGFLGLILYVNWSFASVNRLEERLQKAEGDSKVLGEKLTELSELFYSTLTEEQKKNEDLIERFEDINESVEELEKLSETDPELLQKYSKVYFLNEHYVPVELEEIPEDRRGPSSTSFEIHASVAPYLDDLFDEAEDEGLNLRAQSAYRSFARQSELKASYTVTYGTGANRFSADQGYSEHQLGTTVDFTTVALGGALNGFQNTPEYKWLQDNAHKYGFVLSYPEGNAYYKYEPWHWRFVGESLARRLHNEGKNFYDMDQRVIDSYLSQIFD